MAIFNKGILGAFFEKVGTVIGSTCRRKDEMRSLPRTSKQEASLLQKMQRDKFTLVTNFFLLSIPTQETRDKVELAKQIPLT